METTYVTILTSEWSTRCPTDGCTQVPYKYDLTKFVNVGSISVDHIDPSIFCVLTAKSRDPYTPLADLLIFSPRWDVASRKFTLGL